MSSAPTGKVGGPFEGGDLLLLTTTGARSGASRTTPLGYVRHEDSLLVVGSNLGGPRHPGWYYNLLAHPVVRVEVGTSSFEALAVPAEGARREELFAYVVRAVPGYGDYQERTRRPLPVVVLGRAEPSGWSGPGRTAPSPTSCWRSTPGCAGSCVRCGRRWRRTSPHAPRTPGPVSRRRRGSGSRSGSGAWRSARRWSSIT